MDVWSTGIIFFEMLFARKPFGNGMCAPENGRKHLMTGSLGEDAVATTFIGFDALSGVFMTGVHAGLENNTKYHLLPTDKKEWEVC